MVLLFSLVLLLAGAGLAEASFQYAVVNGESLWKISQRYGTTVEAIAQANNLSNPDLIYPGQVLIIPGGVESGATKYTVVAGDTLFKIALRFGTTSDAIAQINGLANPGLIYPGQVLAVVAGGSSNDAGAGLSRGGRISNADLDLFARLVHSESAGEPYLGQVAVAATVLNRVDSYRFPNTIREVIYQVSDGYYQYSPVQDGRINLPAGQQAHQAVREALGGWDPSYGATGFYNPAKTTNQWVRSQPVTTVIGNHIFFKY
ncbi:MAG: LysM peptidoglycan-binding domain-containing protein [Firmicutes bacterium]|nr:LysM peptidoglycan-binding domain-containing protein [Bacillota bacterium]